MNKLSIFQIINLATKLSKVEWVGILLWLNKNDKLESFLASIRQSDLLKDVLNETKQQKIK